MVIAKMNSVLLKHSRIMFGLFTAIIIISFVWFFTPGASGNILFGTNPMSPNAVVGSVFDREITRGELMEMIKDNMLVISGNGEVIEPDQDFVAIGSGGNFAYSAANALFNNTDMDAEAIVRESLRIASSICVYTNSNISVEKL